MPKVFQAHSSWRLETLETRQLLSAGTGVETLLPNDTAALVAPLLKAPLITGIWTGSTKEYHVAGSLRLTLNIASESRRRGTLAGTATNLNGTAPFKGHITGDAFTLTVNKASGGTIILTGTVNGTTLSGAWVNGGKSGTFSVTRHVA